MKVDFFRINPGAVCYTMAAILAVAYGIWGYLDFFLPVDSGCSGDPAFMAEITAERRADFLVVNIGMLFIFIMSLGALLLGLGAFVTMRDRWGWHT